MSKTFNCDTLKSFISNQTVKKEQNTTFAL